MKISMTEYHHVINRQTYGGNEYGKSGHFFTFTYRSLVYFHILEARNDAFEAKLFSGLHFVSFVHLIKDTDRM